MPRDHEAHYRPRLERWCGGTVPPTELIHSLEERTLTVEIFPEGADIHGYEVDPIGSEQFLAWGEEFTKTDEIPAGLVARYALTALGELRTARGPEPLPEIQRPDSV